MRRCGKPTDPLSVQSGPNSVRTAPRSIGIKSPFLNHRVLSWKQCLRYGYQSSCRWVHEVYEYDDYSRAYGGYGGQVQPKYKWTNYLTRMKVRCITTTTGLGKCYGATRSFDGIPYGKLKVQIENMTDNEIELLCKIQAL